MRESRILATRALVDGLRDLGKRPGALIQASGTGFYGDLTRTVVRGRASDAQRRLWETVLAGQKLALENIRAGELCECGQGLQAASPRDRSRGGN